MPRTPNSAIANDDMPIGLLAQLSGLRASALRYYESEGLIAPTRRVNGRRRYNRQALDRLAIIAMAQDVGFTIAEVRTLLSGFDANPLSKAWKAQMAGKLEEIDANIRRMKTMQRLLREALACGCADAVACAVAARS